MSDRRLRGLELAFAENPCADTEGALVQHRLRAGVIDRARVHQARSLRESDHLPRVSGTPGVVQVRRHCMLSTWAWLGQDQDPRMAQSWLRPHWEHEALWAQCRDLETGDRFQARGDYRAWRASLWSGTASPAEIHSALIWIPRCHDTHGVRHDRWQFQVLLRTHMVPWLLGHGTRELPRYE